MRDAAQVARSDRRYVTTDEYRAYFLGQEGKRAQEREEVSLAAPIVSELAIKIAPYGKVHHPYVVLSIRLSSLCLAIAWKVDRSREFKVLGSWR